MSDPVILKPEQITFLDDQVEIFSSIVKHVVARHDFEESKAIQFVLWMANNTIAKTLNNVFNDTLP